jgi:RNA polymerase sigma factor (sigma-70 family)
MEAEDEGGMDRLEEMCRQEYPRLVGMLGLYCGDADRADDLAQEALVKLCTHWRRVRRMDAPEAWLRRVALNLAHSYYRRRGIEHRMNQIVARRQPARSEAVHDVETLALLRSLPHKQRAAVLLHHYLDLPVREVARVLDVPEGTAKTLVHRGTRKLRAETIEGDDLVRDR